MTDPNRPLLLAPIQGNKDLKWRRQSAEDLQAIGFDAYGLGGWPFVGDGSFDYEFCALNASLTPDPALRFALGVGTPHNIVKLFDMGYRLFDCVLPTRDARHHRLYTWSSQLSELPKTAQELVGLEINGTNWYDTLYINRTAFAADESPIDSQCDCATCVTYSKAYLHHLFKVKEGLALKLATQHNLRFYARMMEVLRNN
jgi:queuine tRNA-ribosyltransferase